MIVCFFYPLEKMLDEAFKRPDVQKAYAAMWIRFRFDRDHTEIVNRENLGLGISMNVK